MTAINVFVDEHAAHIFTDGQGYELDGTLMTVEPKAFSVAHLPAILAASGHMTVTQALTIAAGRLASFDDLKAHIVDMTVKALREFDRYAEAAGMSDRTSGDFELNIAGWSQKASRAEAFLLTNFKGSGHPVGKLVPIEEASIRPCDDALFARLGEMGLAPLPEGFDAEQVGLAIMHEQQVRSWPVPKTGKAARVVGGFCQMTTVTREGVSSRVLERWPAAMAKAA